MLHLLGVEDADSLGDSTGTLDLNTTT
jgi:hypothetical protein